MREQTTKTEGEDESQQAERLDKIVIEGRADSMIGVADSAGQGVIGREELRKRPIDRPGAVLETVPGVVVTQHSGVGKANQFFVRGFNLDHGTDFLIRLGGIPVNLPSHGHGQGYADLNLLIPEIVDTVEYRKGPYDARDGDFGSAGAVDINYVDRLDRGIARFEAGYFQYTRGVVADSFALGDGDLLYAFETQTLDGPWNEPNNATKINGLLRYTTGDDSNRLRVTGQFFDSEWDATDHIPERAVLDGRIDRFDAIDPTDGGQTERFSLSAEWTGRDAKGESRLFAYGVHSDFDLYSNFTYFLDDPVNGDQFKQTDERAYTGIEGSHTWYDSGVGGLEMQNSVGFQTRFDAIRNGLDRTVQRRVLTTTRADDIHQTSLAIWAENRTYWHEKVRSVAGIRGDVYLVDVDSDNPANSGNDDDVLASPKLGLVFGPWADTEFYLNGGFGFHSNDARGVLTRDDPGTVAPMDGMPIKALARSRGADVGVRTSFFDGLESTLTVFYLQLDSELVFVGDAGTTEANRKSERFGFEFANFYRPNDWLEFDADVSWAHARFIEPDPAGDRIPGAVETVVATGVTVERDRWLGSLRLRHFGSYPLSEDNQVRADSSTMLNARVGYGFNDDTTLAVEAFNLLNQNENEIEYFYASRLPGEPAGGVDDVHFHPVVPFSLRFSLTIQF